MVTIHDLAERRSTVTRVLASVAGLLVLAHVGWQSVKYWTGHDYVFGLIKFFHLDEERNLPATFSALLLLSAASLLTFITVHERRKGSRDVARWAILAIGFAYMAIDEFGHIHEQLILPGRRLLGDRTLGVFYYAWVIPAIAVVVVLAGYFRGFMLRLPTRTRFAFTLAAVLFVGGALGFEMFEGRHDELYGERNLAYMALVTVEEGLEMAGVIVFIDALLRYIVDQRLGLTSALPQAVSAIPRPGSVPEPLPAASPPTDPGPVN